MEAPVVQEQTSDSLSSSYSNQHSSVKSKRSRGKPLTDMRAYKKKVMS